MPLDSNKKNISLEVLKNGKKGIKSVDIMGNDKNDIRSANIDQERSMILN